MRRLHPLCRLLLFTLLSSSSAHLQTRPLIFNRQGIDCFTVYSPSQPDNSIPCGGINTYISDKCTCCPSGTIGCSSQHVCAIDPYGGDMCCPVDNPSCSDGSGNGGGAGPAAATTSADNSPATSSTSVDDSQAAPTSSSEENGSGQAAATTPSVASVSSGRAAALKVEGKLPWVAMALLAVV